MLRVASGKADEELKKFCKNEFKIFHLLLRLNLIGNINKNLNKIMKFK